MNRAQFNISFKEIITVLRRWNLLKHSTFRTRPLTSDFLSTCREGDHVKIYYKAVENNDYDFSIYDDSLFQFNYIESKTDGLTLRYAFYQFPKDFPVYEDFLKREGFSYDEVGEAFKEEYEQLLGESSYKKNFVGIRYDYSTKGYKPAIHGVSHLHIGYQNSIRLNSFLCLTPYNFVIFILHQVYYKLWEELMKDGHFVAKFKISRRSCNNIDSRVFQAIDKIHLHLR